MHIEVKKESFLDSLQIVSRAIRKDNIHKILECVLLDATKNKLQLIAQDGKEISIKKEMDAEIKEKGKAAINASYLLDIIRTMPDESFIEIKTNQKNECKFICGSETKIQISDESTFPNISNINKENKIIINEMKIKKIIEKTLFSYDKNLETGNVVLKGIYFYVNKDEITVKSMDGYIISRIKEKIINNENKYEIIIPGSSLEEINKILKGEVNKDVIIYINENNVSFEFNNTLFTTIIIPNKYIDTDRIFNIEYSTKITINKKLFLESLRRSITVLRENESKPVIFDIKDEKINISLNSLFGDFKEEINIEKTGKDLMIAFNAKKLLKIISVLEDEKISIYFSGSKQPLIIKNKQENYTYLLTPVKI